MADAKAKHKEITPKSPLFRTVHLRLKKKMLSESDVNSSPSGLKLAMVEFPKGNRPNPTNGEVFLKMKKCGESAKAQAQKRHILPLRGPEQETIVALTTSRLVKLS